jgi:hypothetical protein
MIAAAKFAVVALFAVGAVHFVVGERPSVVPRNQKPMPNADSSSVTGYQGGCSAFDQIYNTNKASLSSLPKDDDRAAATSLVNTFFGIHSNEALPNNIHYAIALAADPIHTNLSLTFDREMVALQQAAQDDGFTYNSSWLPWRNGGSSLSQVDDHKSYGVANSQRESCPGILLFRHSVSDSPQTSDKGQDNRTFDGGLVVLVVGEQPTGGINENQWANAIRWLDVHAIKASGKVLHILGPSFSGSLVSLERNLRLLYVNPKDKNLHERFSSAVILSGSVRSCSSIRWFQQKLEDQFHLDSEQQRTVSFGTFQENDALQIDRFLRYLHNQGTLGKDTAILAEDETAYANPYSDPKGPDSSAPSCEFPYAYDSRPLRISYPRDISALRTAYEKQSIFTSATAPEHAGHTILQESDDQGNSTSVTDTIPTFSGQLTPIAQEAVLYGIVSYLRVHHTRYLLLRCSNQLDFLFLTRFFHRAYPEGRIVTVGADLLFRREIDSTEFRGVMALSTYPLLPRDQHWSALFVQPLPTGAVRHTHRVFEDQNQQGQYIAARYLLSTDTGTPISEPNTLIFPRPLEPNIPSFAEPFWLPKGAHPYKTTHAPTWLSVVGREGYWPVAVLDENSTPLVALAEGTKPPVAPNTPPSTIVQLTSSGTEYDRDPDHHLNNTILLSPSLSWKLVTSLALFLLLYQAIAIRYGDEHAATRVLSGFRKVSSPWQSFLVGLNCAFATMLLLAPLSAILALPQIGDLAANNIALWVSVFFAFVAIIGLAVLLHDRYQSAAMLSFLGLLSVLIIISLGSLYLSRNSANDLPLAVRIAHLTSGVSPLVPVLFLFGGFYLWSWQTMAGNILLCCGRPVLPPLRKKATSAKDLASCGLHSRQYRISQELGRRILHVASPFTLPLPVLVPTLSLFLVAFFYFHGDLPLVTMESRTFAICINLALLAAFLLTTAEAARLYSTWTELHRLLIALNQTRLRRTFVRLRAIDAHSLWSVSGNVRRVQSLFFTQQLDAATRLLRCIPKPSPTLRAAVIFGDRFVYNNAVNIERGYCWESPILSLDPTGHTTIREVFADAVAEVLNDLIPAWKKETDSLSLEGDDTGSGDDKGQVVCMGLSKYEDIRAAEEFVCFHYIAFIQNILARMRTMTFSMGALFVAICFAISFYPFVPRTEIGIWIIANLTLIAIAAISVYAGMERDSTLSYITNSTPGHLSSAFWLKSAGFLAGPLIGVLATQFPAIADSVLAWVQPGLDAISR